MHPMWVISYWKYGSLSKRDPKLLSHIVPSVHRRPMIYGMSQEEIAEVVDGPRPRHTVSSSPSGKHKPKTVRRGLTGNSGSRSLHMKTSPPTAQGRSPFLHVARWRYELQDNPASGCKSLFYEAAKIYVNCNIWDDPEKALQAYLEPSSRARPSVILHSEFDFD
ncbi:hypothetical protein BKA93DRAFT_750108 [Sparassis latifolia]